MHHPHAVTLESITTRQIYDMAVRRHWHMPRTFDRTDPNCRYFHHIAHLTPEQQRKQIAKWAAGITQPYITTQHQDILLRIMLSALPIGHNKAKIGYEHCPHHSCAAAPTEESAEHLFMKCPTTLQTIRHIFTLWEKTTGEHLDPTHVPTVLFGDRATDQTNAPPELEEPFRVVQATLMHTLWIARNQRAHPKSPNGKRITYSQQGLLTDIRRRVQTQLSHIYTRARETHQISAFNAASADVRT